MRIGIIGAGAIAQFLLKVINLQQLEEMQIKSILVRNKEKYKGLESEFRVRLYTELEEFLDSEIDIVVEAADIQAVKNLLPTVIMKKDAVLISVGALADEDLLSEISHLIAKYKHTVHLPSGAIGGLDLLKNANALGTVTNVSLTTRKPAHSLIKENIQEAKVLFEGKAVDAIKQFPKNLNVSIVLSLAGLGIDKTNVSLVADPHIEKNVHQIDIKGDFGEATITVSNNPFPENPKTSYLAAMSILGTLKGMKTKLTIGG